MSTTAGKPCSLASISKVPPFVPGKFTSGPSENWSSNFFTSADMINCSMCALRWERPPELPSCCAKSQTSAATSMLRSRSSAEKYRAIWARSGSLTCSSVARAGPLLPVSPWFPRKAPNTRGIRGASWAELASLDEAGLELLPEADSTASSGSESASESESEPSPSLLEASVAVCSCDPLRLGAPLSPPSPSTRTRTRHIGHTSLSMSHFWMWGLQKLWPHGSVTGATSKSKQMLHFNSSACDWLLSSFSALPLAAAPAGAFATLRRFFKRRTCASKAMSIANFWPLGKGVWQIGQSFRTGSGRPVVSRSWRDANHSRSSDGKNTSTVPSARTWCTTPTSEAWTLPQPKVGSLPTPGCTRTFAPGWRNSAAVASSKSASGTHESGVLGAWK
mmetsp:Transcript_37172/g.112398  ORF Transcript_37172/g.112398 Transcript_37172/m.112398 type:complete len:391 (-) Transcript_37172:158-1330(-)